MPHLALRRAAAWRPGTPLPARATTPSPGPQSEDPPPFAGRAGCGRRGSGL